MEVMDIYTKDREKIERVHVRGQDEDLKDGDYVLVVQVIIKNNKNELLMTKRSARKKISPLKWELTQGSVQQGEDTVQAILREMREEIGVEADNDYLELYRTFMSAEEHVIKDVFLYKGTIELKNLKFADGEVIDAKWVDKKEFEYLFSNNMTITSIELSADEIYNA